MLQSCNNKELIGTVM